MKKRIELIQEGLISLDFSKFTRLTGIEIDIRFVKEIANFINLNYDKLSGQGGATNQEIERPITRERKLDPNNHLGGQCDEGKDTKRNISY